MPRKRPAFNEEQMKKFIPGYLHPTRKREHPAGAFRTEKELEKFLQEYVKRGKKK
jgi:hypothetical protein